MRKMCSQYVQFSDDILSDIAEGISPAEGERIVTYSFRMFQERTGLHTLAPQRFEALREKVIQEVDEMQETFKTMDDKENTSEQGVKTLSAEYLAPLRDFKWLTP